MNIGIASSNPSFTNPIIQELDRRGHHCVVCRHEAEDAHNAYRVGQLIRMCDAIFVDFAQDPWHSIAHECECPLTVRMHRVEVYEPRNYQMTLQATGQQIPPPWEKVTNLIFVADHVRTRFLENAQLRGTPLPANIHTIPHVGVNLELFKPPTEARDWEKPPYRVLMAGNIVPKKRQYSMVEMWADVQKQWPGMFQLTLIGGGGMPGYGNVEYHENISDLIRRIGFKKDEVTVAAPCPHEDMPTHMGRAHFILSGSNEEGCATTVAEAMATGCIPLVHHWRGAEDLYPKRWLWGSPMGFYELLKGFAEAKPETRSRWSQGAVRHAAQYDQAAIVAKTCDLIQWPKKAVFYDTMLEHFVEQRDNVRQQVQGDWMLSKLPGPQARVLEVGCAIGRQTELAARANIQRVVGCDISRRCIFHAISSAGQQGLMIEYDLLEEGERYKLPEGPFDVVMCFDVVEHMHPNEWGPMLRQVVDRMDQGAVLLLSFPYQAQKPELGQQVVEYRIFPKHIMQALKELGLEVELYGTWDISGEASDYRVEARKP